MFFLVCLRLLRLDYIPGMLDFLSFYCLELDHYCNIGRDVAKVQEVFGVISPQLRMAGTQRTLFLSWALLDVFLTIRLRVVGVGEADHRDEVPSYHVVSM